MARLFVAFGGLVVLVLTAALVGPYFIDWTSYRGDFEREASRVLGRDVTVEGEASARLLPFPSVTFSDVRVTGEDGEPVLTAETFSMDAELAPFLRGELLIFDMRLERPKGVIRISEEGAIDWATRSDTPFDAEHVSLEKLTVHEGSVVIEHAASGRTHRITEINATVSAGTFAGPWRFDGSARFDGALTDIDASTGRSDGNGAMRLRVRAKPRSYPLTLETEGTAAVDRGELGYAGTFRLSAYNQENLLRGTDGVTFAPAGDATGAKAPPDYRVSGAFSVDHRRIAASEFRFETGPLDNPYIAEGKADLDIGGEPRFSIEATGAQFSFDERIGEDDGKAAQTLASRIGALKSFVVALPRPTIPGSIDVALPAVVVGDTTFREVRLSAEPADNGWSVADFAFSMPGRATLEANGLVAISDEDARFSGDMLLAVGQPSGFAAWLSKDVDEAIRRLPAAGFKAKVELASERQQFEDFELQLGDARFAGKVDSLTPDDARPALLLRLDGGRLDVEGLAAFASLFVTDGGESRAQGRDLDLAVTAGPVTAQGLTAGKVDVALRFKGDDLEIDRFTIGDLAGANVSATGRVTGFPLRPAGSFDLALVSDDLAPLAMMIGDRFAGNRVAAELGRRFASFPGLGSDTELNIVATASREGETARYALSAGGKMGGGEVTATYSGEGDPASPTNVDLNLSLRNPDGAHILALGGLPTLPLAGLGPTSADVTLKGRPADGMAATLSLAAGELKAGFAGTVTDGAEGVSLSGKANVEAGDVAPWLQTVGMTLPGMALGVPVRLEGDLSLARGVLDSRNLAGIISSVPVKAAVSATLKDGKPSLGGSVETGFLPLDLVMATVLGEGAMTSTDGNWASTPFPARIEAPLLADLQLKAGEVAWGPDVVARDVAAKMQLTAGKLSISEISGEMAGGRLSGLFDLRNDGGTGMASGQISLAGADLAAVDWASGLEGRADLSVNLAGSGKSVSALVASLSGNGTASARDLTVPNIDPKAFPSIIAGADRLGRAVSEATVAGYVPEVVRAGSFAAAGADVAFTVAAGVVRTPPVTLAAPGATLSASVRLDLPQWLAAAEGEIDYVPGNEVLVGSQPSVKFHAEGEPGAVALALDTQPMAQFLTQRALEIEQARVEAMQAVLLEKQRLRRETRYYAALVKAREEARRKAEEEARLKAEEEARAKAAAVAAEAERIRREEQARAEEAARLKAGQEAAAEAEAKALRQAEDAAQRAPAAPVEEKPAEGETKPGLTLRNLLDLLDNE